MIDIYYVNGVETPQEQITVRHIFTNADRIRAMSDEELANCLLCKRSVPHCPPIDMTKYAPCDDVEDCTACWLEWLKREANDGQAEKENP